MQAIHFDQDVQVCGIFQKVPISKIFLVLLVGLWGCYASQKTKLFDLINQELLLVIDHGITTRHAGAVEATRCRRARRSSAVQLLTSVLLMWFVFVLQMQHLRGIHTYREEALCLRTARSTRNNKRGRGMGGGCQKWRDHPSPVTHPSYIGVPNELPNWRSLVTLSLV
jgi:hypothetical protein